MLYIKWSFLTTGRLPKKSSCEGPDIFLRLETDLNFSRPQFLEIKVQIKRQRVLISKYWKFMQLKSYNLQYHSLGGWVIWIISLTKRLIFQIIFFFHHFLQNSLQKLFQLFFIQASNPLFYFQFIKIILWQSDAWSIRRSTQQPRRPFNLQPLF